MKNYRIFIFTCFLVTFISAEAQNSFISELKSKGKDSIIQYSKQKLKEKNIINIPADTNKIKVFANKKDIMVLFNMGFCWDDQQNVFDNYELKVIISEEGYTIYPADFDPDSNAYKLNADQKKIIKFVMQSYPCPFRQDERVTISEKECYYEMICSRGIEKGAECYHIDKKSGERKMVWHETPYPGGDKNKLLNSEEEYKEIK